MINPYLADFKKKKDDEVTVKTPSQDASFQEKQKNNPYFADFVKKKQDTFTPVEQPKKQEEPKKSFFQKAKDVAKKTFTKENAVKFGGEVKDFFIGDKEQKTDEKYLPYMEGVIKDNQEVGDLSRSRKQELINYLKDNISQDSKNRDMVIRLTPDNFNERKREINNLLGSPLDYKVTGEKEVGKGIFKRKEKTRGYDSKKGQDLWHEIKTLDYAKSDNDEFLGEE